MRWLLDLNHPKHPYGSYCAETTKTEDIQTPKQRQGRFLHPPVPTGAVGAGAVRLVRQCHPFLLLTPPPTLLQTLRLRLRPHHRRPRARRRHQPRLQDA